MLMGWAFATVPSRFVLPPPHRFFYAPEWPMGCAFAGLLFWHGFCPHLILKTIARWTKLRMGGPLQWPIFALYDQNTTGPL